MRYCIQYVVRMYIPCHSLISLSVYLSVCHFISLSLSQALKLIPDNRLFQRDEELKGQHLVPLPRLCYMSWLSHTNTLTHAQICHGNTCFTRDGQGGHADGVRGPHTKSGEGGGGGETEGQRQREKEVPQEQGRLLGACGCVCEHNYNWKP